MTEGDTQQAGRRHADPHPAAPTTLVLDPRMPAPEMAKLAPRHSVRAVHSVTMLDNGKIAGGCASYAAMFDVIADELTTRWTVGVQRRVADLLTADLPQLEQLASDLARERPAGVVIGVGDWGVTQPTAVVAVALEKRGVPTVVITTDGGFAQAVATASWLLPGLPILRASLDATSGLSAGVAEGHRLAPLVFDSLTWSGDGLLERFWSSGMPTPAVAAASGTIEIVDSDVGAAFTRMMEEDRVSDGLPLVAPTPRRVDAFLAAAGYAGDEPIWAAIPPRPSPVTASHVARLAVMAGCKAQSAPVVYAAFLAMGAPEFRLFHAATTTHPSGTLVLVSAPEPEPFGVVSGYGCLGPGSPANATIGRSVALSYRVLLGAIPGTTDLTTQGSPAEYAYCCAENVAASPWTGLHSDLGHPNSATVTVLKSEGPHNVLDALSTTPESLLDTFASTMATLGANASYALGGQLVVFLNPAHAALLSRAGWTKREVADRLFRTARNRRSDLRGRGIAPVWDAEYDRMEFVPLVRDASDILIVVAGGAGPSSQVALPWGYSRGVTRPLTKTR